MKLILKQYLASLRERGELDVVLPDLLSQMGLNVFISPTRGVKEYGVDIAAVGSIKEGGEKVYLFSVKAGNLTRSTWDGSSDQALRPSLNEIQDSFIPNRIPPEHLNKPIVICLCFGGDVSSVIRQEVTGYEKNNTRGNISFEEWNGDKLSELIIEYLLKEELLPKDWQSLLRKSLALIDEPESSHNHFQRLICFILERSDNDEKASNALNKINLYLWILFAWCREESNLESAYLSAEKAVLLSWESIKEYNNSKVTSSFSSLLSTYHSITSEYIDNRIIPHTHKKHAISNAISSPCSIDINLKLFDLLGRISIKGVWILQQLTQSYEATPPTDQLNTEQTGLINKLDTLTESLKQLIHNNPLLLSPYKDSQAIDIALALYLLCQDDKHDEFVVSWLEAIIENSIFTFASNGMYPTILQSYEQLLEHRHKDKANKKYKHKVTQGSILYPLLALYCALYKAENAGGKLTSFAEKDMKHCTLQYWYPNSSSEGCLYSNSDTHGTASTDFPIHQKDVIKHVSNECQMSKTFHLLSAVNKGHYPLVLLACRCYRYPIPFHVLEDWMQLQ
ncbi:hypothetical protein [Neptuniibacter marinus]|uniref:hypothetical protein n=1 Tax=Neptuniibacter marinus TaxID=1806670 RepID=UPI003B5BCD1B